MRYRFLRFPGGKDKAVTFSYDDGFRYDIRLAQTLDRYRIKGTFNLNSATLGRPQYLTKEEAEQHLLARGHEIAIHGADHRAPGCQRPIDGIQEVLNCRLALESAFGRIIRGMAYPDSGIQHLENGASVASIEGYLKDLDIAYARTAGQDNDRFELPTDWLRWMPTVHHTNPLALSYADRFVKLDQTDAYIDSRWPKLFYLWGHSYEFARNDNWELLDALCEKLGGKEDIWYATNMEIYDYVSAYNALIFSADGTLVHNSTPVAVWFDADRTLYRLEGGQTIRMTGL